MKSFPSVWACFCATEFPPFSVSLIHKVLVEHTVILWIMSLPSFVSSANFVSTCWRSEPTPWEKILSKISFGNSPEEVPLSLWLFSIYLCFGPCALSQSFTHFKIHASTSAVSRYIHMLPWSLFGTPKERFTAKLISKKQAAIFYKSDPPVLS